MKFASYLVIFFVIFLFQCSNGSNIIHKSCKRASENNPTLDYDYCFASLQEASAKSKAPPNKYKDLVLMSIHLTQSNQTNMVSIISELLKSNTVDENVKACLRDCLDLYTDSASSLDDALNAFKSKDYNKASTKLSAALDNPVNCEDHFTDKGVDSPLTIQNRAYLQQNAISLALIKLARR